MTTTPTTPPTAKNAALHALLTTASTGALVAALGAGLLAAHLPAVARWLAFGVCLCALALSAPAARARAYARMLQASEAAWRTVTRDDVARLTHLHLERLQRLRDTPAPLRETVLDEMVDHAKDEHGRAAMRLRDDSVLVERLAVVEALATAQRQGLVVAMELVADVAKDPADVDRATRAMQRLGAMVETVARAEADLQKAGVHRGRL